MVHCKEIQAGITTLNTSCSIPNWVIKVPATFTLCENVW